MQYSIIVELVSIFYTYVDEEFEYHEQVEEMNDWDWDEFLAID